MGLYYYKLQKKTKNDGLQLIIIRNIYERNYFNRQVML